MIALQHFPVILAAIWFPATSTGQMSSMTITASPPSQEISMLLLVLCTTASHMEATKTPSMILPSASAAESMMKISMMTSYSTNTTVSPVSTFSTVHQIAPTTVRCILTMRSKTTAALGGQVTSTTCTFMAKPMSTDAANEITVPINAISISIVSVIAFITVIVMPLTIMTLTVALGCTCKRYRNLKKLVKQSNNVRPTTEEDHGVCNNVMMMEEIQTDENIAYSRKESYAYVMQNPYDSIHISNGWQKQT